MISPGLQAAITVIFGAVAGGVTNSVAIWMLFHPYEPPRLFGRRLGLLQGAIPKNKARLAAAMGRTVGNRLLTSEDLALTLGEPGFRRAFDEQLGAFITAVLERERGPLAELLPAPLAGEARRLLDEVARALVDRLDAYLASDEFCAAAVAWATSVAEQLRDQPIGELLTPEREAALAETARNWIADAVGGAGLRRAIEDYLDEAARRLLQPDRTFEDVLPIGLVAAGERAVSSYLPVALERLAGLLDDPDARAQLQRVLHEILDRFVRDLKFHQRLVAALVIPPDVVDRVIAAIEKEGAAKIAEVLRDPAMRDAMARSVNHGVVDFLRRPVTSVLGRPGDASVEQAKATLAEAVLRFARDEQTSAFLVSKLQATLNAAERRTWGDVFRRLPPEQVARLVVAALRSERARAYYREVAERLAQRVLERPIGRPADHLPPDAPARLERALAEPLWTWVQEQVPRVAQRIDIAGKVERKILDYPTAQVEEMIRNVTGRELTLIVRLGYVLGAGIGLVSAIINFAFR